MSFTFKHPYTINPEYATPVAYFCMEYAIHQPLKIYAGGLGYLAGSHLKSAFELKQNVVGIGIFWKYGYYDQIRKSDQTMEVLFQEKVYAFLQPTGIKFKITVSSHDVWVTAYYLPCSVFNSAPLFLLSTDLPENDYLARTISHKLYDSNPETRIASSILLGIGGCKLLEYLSWKPEVYHINESHALPVAFYLFSKYSDVNEVKKRLVFTNHTPEEGGNPNTSIWLLQNMGFFYDLPISIVKTITSFTGDQLNHTHAALKLSGMANGVSRLHNETLSGMWKYYNDLCPLISITNAQSFSYWADKKMYELLQENKDDELVKLKISGKEQLFEIVADQNGEILDKNILTIVFAKRFTGYKRADLLLHNPQRFDKMMKNSKQPIQIIWAGKPYPADYSSIGIFDKIVNVCKSYNNCSVLSGYELKLSRLLKNGADIWLNVPRKGHEASGTSGMSAAMNGALNLTIPDGWVPEFAKDKINCFVIPHANPVLTDYQQDEIDANNLYDLLENEVIPMYYDHQDRWLSMIKSSMRDIIPYFDSNRMVSEYYKLLYCAAKGETKEQLRITDQEIFSL
jgi:glycogen phosphorylase